MLSRKLRREPGRERLSADRYRRKGRGNVGLIKDVTADAKTRVGISLGHPAWRFFRLPTLPRGWRAENPSISIGFIPSSATDWRHNLKVFFSDLCCPEVLAERPHDRLSAKTIDFSPREALRAGHKPCNLGRSETGASASCGAATSHCIRHLVATQADDGLAPA